MTIWFPRAMLDGFFVEQKRAVAARLLAEFDWLRTNPFDAIPENELLDWCKEEPEARYALAAAIVTFATAPDSSGRRHWSSVALQLLKHAPDRISVLKEFVAQFTPMSWSGSLAAAMEPNLKLLDDLETYPDDKLAAVVAQHRIQLSQFIERERLREAAEDKQRDERFE
jgi:nitroreductase